MKGSDVCGCWDGSERAGEIESEVCEAVFVVEGWDTSVVGCVRVVSVLERHCVSLKAIWYGDRSGSTDATVSDDTDAAILVRSKHVVWSLVPRMGAAVSEFERGQAVPVAVPDGLERLHAQWHRAAALPRATANVFGS